MSGEVSSVKVAVIGAGSIGMAFAIVFASAGHRVTIYDTDPERLGMARDELASALSDLARHDLLQENASAVLTRIAVTGDLAEAVQGALWIQECAPEKLDLKRALIADLDSLAQPDAVIASSASAIPSSQSTGHLPGSRRCLVCHPANPPFLLRVIEIVPHAGTDPAVSAFAREFLSACGMQPVMVGKEIEGFVFNRLQGALLREAYCLVRDDVASVEDIDTLVRDGLGLRWSFMGPFETVDLNTRGGLAAHAEKIGPAYRRMGLERGQDDPWTDALVDKATAQRRSLLPLEGWDERRAWRDRRLMALIRHRRNQEVAP
ncbi:MAG: 3-hydroxyacyl-CoA dehydrogenase [Roseitalea sp.]|nr:3-hydroxyacyl-CoA dehydrogenase [Roseitalea sp.]MBO6720668.1 3-hydroxyacyl-CoA dehydrogenase [Roseitalea sp.]MBO6743815.1 3-hydroxyacyl-CoA dehydrogenase [Roseitalea sp.]